MTDLREKLADEIEVAIDNVHDMDALARRDARSCEAPARRPEKF